MTKKEPVLLSLLFLLIFQVMPVLADPVSCAECGMMVDMNSPYASRIMSAGKTDYFCDIGDLLTHVNKTRTRSGSDRMEVRDYSSGEWLDVRDAHFVHGQKQFKTPMGWGLGAFKHKQHASRYGTLMNFEKALNAVR